MEFFEGILNNKYIIQDKISENILRETFIATEKHNGKNKFSIKKLNSRYISNRIEDIIRFHNEINRIALLKSPYIEKVYEVIERDNIQYLVAEYYNGKTLFDILHEGYVFNEKEIIDVIIKIAEGLMNAHNNEIIHRDLNVANIIIVQNSADIELKISDFGISRIKEFSAIKDPGEIYKTFCYKSPEECGVINRNVEESSDLYSLGIIMFQLLTGKVPFSGNTVNSIIHQHIARIPEFPPNITPPVPEMLKNIILKLLEKEPGQRYQSAKGLLRDLEKYKQGETDFIPGLQDEVIHLSYKTNLIGRNEEFISLKKLLHNAIDRQKGSISLICGPSGQGKSRLVEELLNYAYSQNIPYINGKCFAGENKIPYIPFKEALTQYMVHFRTYPAEKKIEIRNSINSGIGYLGEIILNLNPAMKEIITETHQLVEMEKDKESIRFLMAVSQFLNLLADAEKGLVIHFDDLQWADEGSIDIIKVLLNDIDIFPLFIIGTCRDDELTVAHGMTSLINDAFNQGLPLYQVLLEALGKEDMYSYVSTILHTRSEEIGEISEFIRARSNGNPFFATEIIKQLINEKALYYQDDSWALNNHILAKIEVSTAVIEVVLKRIALLDNIEKDILSYAAIIGREFEISLLFTLCEYKKDLIVKVVDRAITLHLLEYEIQKKTKIFFVHERIKEAFYEIIPEARRKKIHNKIARSLESLGSSSAKDILFDLVNHYICGENENKILEYAYPAGIKAKSNYAHEEAFKYFNKAIDILEKKDLIGSGLWIDSIQNMAEVCLVIGKYDKGVTLLTSVLPYLKLNIDRANIHRQISDAYYRKGEYINCEKSAKDALDMLDEKIPIKKQSVVLSLIKELLVHILDIIFPFFIYKSKKANIKKNKLLISIYSILGWSYILSDLLKFIRTTLRMLSIVERRIPKSKESALSMIGYASFCQAIPLFKRALKYHEKALIIKKEINDEYGITQSLQIMGFCYEWMGKYNTAIKYFKDSAEAFKAIGDIKEYGTTLLGIATSSTYLSNYQETEKVLKIHSEIALKTKDAYAICVNYYNSAKLCFDKGLINEAESQARKGYNQSYRNELWFLNCCSCIMLGEISLAKENTSEAIKKLEEARNLQSKNTFLFPYIAMLFPLLAEAYLLAYIQNRDFTLQLDRGYLQKIKKACREAINRTKSWPTHYGSALLAYAKFCALNNKNKKAERYFVHSIKHCEKIHREYEKAKALFDYGNFLKQIGNETDAVSRFKKAYNVFNKIGSMYYRAKLEKILGFQDTDKNSLKNRFINKQRFSSIMEVSQDIGSILRVDELQSKVLQKAVEITGAQRGYLYIKNDETDQLELRAKTNEKDQEPQHTEKEVIEKVFNSGQSLISSGSEKNLGSVLCVPLRSQNTIIGVCFLKNELSKEVFSGDDKEVLEIIMTQAAIYIINAQLYELATTDGLTKLFIYRHFQHLLDLEIKRYQRYKHPCSLIMIDVDFFKIFNDNFGHQLGDEVLVSVARIIKDNCRDTDHAARYGGEEFCIILPETNCESAKILAEKIREEVEQLKLEDDINQVITISLGIAEVMDKTQTKDKLIKAADLALYKAKKDGRNRTVIYNPGLVEFSRTSKKQE